MTDQNRNKYHTQQIQNSLGLDLEQSIQRAFALGEELTEEQKRSILENRARMLAQPISESESQTGDMLRVLSFHIGNELYAFPAASVSSVNKSIAITPVPCVPSFVSGITNLRGHIRSVVKMAEFLGFDVPTTDEDYVIVVQLDDMEVAFIVSALDEVTDIPVKDIKPRPMTSASNASQYIAGVVPGGLILLDLAAIFSDDRFIVNDEFA